MFELLKFNKPFRNIFLSDSFSSFASSLVMFVLPLWVMDMTNSAFKVGMVSAVMLVIATLFTPFTGTIADRYAKTKIMIIGHFICFIAVFFIAYLSLFHHLYFILLLSLVMIRGIGASISSPAAGALLITIVDKEELTPAVSLNQISSQVTNILGPFLGGVLLGLTTYSTIFFIDSIAFLIAMLVLSKLHLKSETNKNLRPQRPFWKDFKEGFSVLFFSKKLAVFIVSAAIINIIGSALVLTIQVYVVKENLSQMWWGIIFASSPIGVILGALVVKKIKQGEKALYRSFLTMSVMGMFNVLMGFFASQPFIFSVLFCLSGFFFGISNVYFGTLYRQMIPETLQGRFFGFLGSALLIAVPLGKLLIGAILEFAHTHLIIIILGMITTLVCFLSYFIVKNEATKPQQNNPKYGL